MQIWLGKQYLGQRDNLDQRVNAELQIRADFSKLDDAELAELERLRAKHTRKRSMSRRLRWLLHLTSKSARAIRLRRA